MLKRFLITSKNFEGNAEIVYNNSVLQSINFAEAAMIPAQRKSFKEAVPVGMHGLEAFVKQYNVVCVEAEYEVTFADFWNGYGKKLNKDRSEKLWAKMTKTEQVLCVMSLPAYHAWRNRWNKFQYDADRYLREKMWENEWKKLGA